jgi:hypothetical protein
MIDTIWNRIGLGCVVTALLVPGSGAVHAADWASWRGPTQDGVSYEKGLPASAEEVLWRAPFGGRSTPVIVGGRVFGINLAGEGVMEQDRVFALDLHTGKLLWEHRFNVFHTDVPNTRVGWASLVADPETGYVYAHGVEGMFLCLDRDGRLIWSRSLTELYGRISGYGGRTHTPILDEDRVVISFVNSSFGAHAVGAHRYLAMDKRTGEVVWWGAPGGKPEDTTYSTPVVAVINGQRLLIAGNADGAIYAMNARTGNKVWGFNLSQRGMNSSVVVDGYRVYAAHGDENFDSTAMGRVVCIDGRGSGDITKTHEIWRRDGLEVGYSSPLLHGGRLYVVENSGVLRCLDATSGKDIWRQSVGRIGKGSPVWGDGKIYVTTADGRFATPATRRRSSTGPRSGRRDRGPSRCSARRRSPAAASSSLQRRRWSALGAIRTRKPCRFRRARKRLRPIPRRSRLSSRSGRRKCCSSRAKPSSSRQSGSTVSGGVSSRLKPSGPMAVRPGRLPPTGGFGLPRVRRGALAKRSRATAT